MDLSYDLSSLMFSYLIVADRGGVLIGDLATEVPSLANGGISRRRARRTRTICAAASLWHDGVPLTSRDVAFSWRAIMSPRNNVLHREGYEEVTLDRHARRPHGRRAPAAAVSAVRDAVLHHAAGRREARRARAPARRARVDRRRAVQRASGRQRAVPFRALGSRLAPRARSATTATFRGRPKLDRVELTIVPDENTMMTQLRTHAVDMPVSTSALAWDRFGTSPECARGSIRGTREMLLALDDARPILRDVAVRRAIASAIDYRAIIHKLTFDSAAIANDVDRARVHRLREQRAVRVRSARARKRCWNAPAGARGPTERAPRTGRRSSSCMVVASKGSGPLYAVQLQRMLRDVGIARDDQGVSVQGRLRVRRADRDRPLRSRGLREHAAVRSRPHEHAHLRSVHAQGDERVPLLRSRDRRARTRKGSQPTTRCSAPRYYRTPARASTTTSRSSRCFCSAGRAVMNDDLRGYDPSPVAAPWWNAWQWDI